MTSRATTQWRRRLAVVVGGMIGTSLRLLVSTTSPATTDGWPWATFVVNLTGALVLGYLLTRLLASGRGSTVLVPLIATGVLGSYTTFSILSMETLAMIEDGRRLTGAAYGVSSMAAGYALALAGIRFAERRR